MSITADPRVTTDEQREAIIAMALRFLVKGGIKARVRNDEDGGITVTIKRPWRTAGPVSDTDVTVYCADDDL